MTPVDELAVDRQSLSAFNSQVVQQAIGILERMRSSLADGHVSADAYSRTEAGQVAQQGHTDNIRALDSLFRQLHTLLTDFGERVHRSASTYQSAETSTTADIRGLSL